jgi:hypothetical protein
MQHRRRYFPLIRIIVLALLVSVIAPGKEARAATSLTTTYAGSGTPPRNRQGIMFDVTAINDLTINRFDSHFSTTGAITVRVYYKVGTHAGFETNPGAWTLLGSTGVVGAGLGNPVAVNIGGLTIPAGQTYGLYIGVEPFTPDFSSIYYSQASSTTTYANSDLSIAPGTGIGNKLFSGDPGAHWFCDGNPACPDYVFGTGLFSPRGFEGTIYYTVIAPPTPGAGVSFFNPQDGRVDPRPGDRIAVYCNNPNPDRIVVYGIADDVPGPRNGFLLVVFSYKAILAAGDKGVTLSAGENGTVSASLMKGWFWIAWNGGKYRATGQGDFKKNFESVAWCPSLGK